MTTEAGEVPLSCISASQKLNFECGMYSLKRVPRVLEMDCSGVYLHKDGPFQDEIKSLQEMDWLGDRVLTPKLMGDSDGDFTLLVGIINTKHFDNREKLDALYAKEYGQNQPVMNVERISFKEALRHLAVDISCNMEYYSSNQEEIEKDLGRKLENFDVNNEEMMKHLESELLYNQAVKIFGEENSDDVSREVSSEHQIEEKSLTFRDFHILYSDGNFKTATAGEGDHYLLFFYATS